MLAGGVALGLQACNPAERIRINRIALQSHGGATACSTQVTQGGRYDAVLRHLDISSMPRRPSARLLANAARPTAEEGALLRDWWAATEPCRRIWYDGGLRISPEVAEVILWGQREREAIFMTLAAGGMTWGDANRRAMEHDRVYQARLNAAVSELERL